MEKREVSAGEEKEKGERGGLHYTPLNSASQLHPFPLPSSISTSKRVSGGEGS